MSRFVRSALREIALFTVEQLVVTRLDTWARRGSTERRDAWARAAQSARRFTVEELFNPSDHLYAMRAKSTPFRWRHPFARRPRSSAEIIAAQVLGRRKNTWTPF